tara:strand:+ start:1574 stop:2059 length:486 start_codon:yes stop_codon:yes gene_type:complete
MSEQIDWERLTTPHIVTSKQMIGIILFVEIVIQTIALLVAPTQWWIWQLLGFITATNLGAVILAVIAQKTANDIGKNTRAAFTPEFYKTITLLSSFHRHFEAEAQAEGRDLDAEVADLAPKVWGLVRAKIDVDSVEADVAPMSADMFKDEVTELPLETVKE